MARLSWGSAGNRFFESGADRGVLYLDGIAGVPWNGLKRVSESPEGGEPRPYYVDGYKYLNVAAAEDFKASLSAFSAPPEFGVCDGTVSIHNGLFVTQQPRKPFGLAYRTLLGNDLAGIDAGYKIHLVYNALAAPSTRENTSIGSSATPLDLSWAISVTPPKIVGLRPTGHFVIDSRVTPPRLMAAVEDILYGTSTTDPRLPTVDELIALFNSIGPLIGTNLAINPDVVNTSGMLGASGQTALTYEGSAARFSLLTSGGAAFSLNQGITFVPGTQYRMLVRIRANRPLTVIPWIRSTMAAVRGIDTEWHWIDEIITAGSGGTSQTGILMSSNIPYTSSDYVEVDRVLYGTDGYSGPHFSGRNVDDDIAVYDWLGAVDASPSTKKSWY